MAWFVYLLQCGDGRIYTGMTDDVERRMTEHQRGQGGRFTKGMQPVELLYQEAFGTQREAVARERQLKSWTRAKKLALIERDLQALKRA